MALISIIIPENCNMPLVISVFTSKDHCAKNIDVKWSNYIKMYAHPVASKLSHHAKTHSIYESPSTL